jgi:hypothetical protein
MPTLEHNGLVELFRANPSIAPQFIESLFNMKVPTYTSVTVVEAAQDQMLPIEFRADLVLELRNAAGELVLAVVIEIQRKREPVKKYTWPLYVAAVRAQKRCDAIVLVVALDPNVARWASEPIDLGLGLGTLQPLVLGPRVVPEVTDAKVAAGNTELSVLSGLVHGNGPNGLAVVTTTFATLCRLDPEHAVVYFQMVYDVLQKPIRQALEAMVMERMTGEKATFPPFAQALIDRGLREGVRKGVRKGKREGKREGKLEGKLEGKREDLLQFLKCAGIATTKKELARIEACTDVAILDTWISRVFGARSAADVLS